MKKNSNQQLDTAFSALSMDGGPIDVNEIAEYLSIEKQSVYRKVKKHEGFKIEGGYIERVSGEESLTT